jgi:CBS domain-containing protein/sporulation protein YlmC with PRC-barrel domain
MNHRAQLHVLREFFFSQIQGEPIYDPEGNRVGKLRDLAIRWEGEGPPRVTGIKFAKGYQKHIPIDKVEEMTHDNIRLVGKLKEEDLIPLQPDEIYVGKWLMDKQIIDLKGSKVVRVNDIKLFWVKSGDRKYVIPMAVDIGLRGLARRLGLEFLFKRLENQYVLWQFIQHLEERTAALQLRAERAKLDQLHPADLADLIEDLDYKKRTDFMEDLDVEVAAEAFSEMERDTQIEILEHMNDMQASDLLEEMPPDEVADILGELPEAKADALLNLMEPEGAQEVRQLMVYEEGTAGSLMTTEYIALSPQITVTEAFAQLRHLAREAETIYYLYLVEDDKTLSGVLSLRELLMAEPDAVLRDLMQTRIITVHPQDSEQTVAENLKKYDLLTIPVVDEANRMLGIITVDDILEVLIPDRSSLETFANFFVSKRTVRG